MPTRRTFLTAAAALASVSFLPRAALAAAAPRGTAGPDDAEAFLAAVERGDLDAVQAQLAASPALADVHDASGRSALVLACAAGHAEVASALVAAGATVRLVEAAMLPDWERAEALAAADPEALDRFHPVGGSVLYASALAGQTEFYRLKALGAQPDANPRGRLGVTPAYGALLCPSPTDSLRALVELLGNGGHVNAPQRGGDSLLHVAARRGDPAHVRYLLRRGADVDALDEHGLTPVALAKKHGHRAIAELLLHPERVPRDDLTLRWAADASGERVRWPDLSDLTLAEHHAVTGPSHGKLAVVRALVDGDSRRSFCRSSEDELAVEACGHTGVQEITRYHLERGVPQSVATSLSIGDLARARRQLAEHPGSVRERGPHDFPLMWYASIGGGSVEAAELLLEAGADVDQESVGTTALHQAAGRGQVDLVRFLAERGARLDAVGYKGDRAGLTPLAAARAGGHADVVTLLEQLGAS